VGKEAESRDEFAVAAKLDFFVSDKTEIARTRSVHG
jgi:hypothetical protein